MLVRRLGPDVFLNTATSCAIRVSSVEDVQDDVGRVDDLVQLVPDTLASSLHEDELPRLRKVAVGIVVISLDIARCT